MHVLQSQYDGVAKVLCYVCADAMRQFREALEEAEDSKDGTAFGDAPWPSWGALQSWCTLH